MTGHLGGLLSAHLDDELTPRERGTVDRHLAECDGCRDELATLRTTRAALRALPAVAPPLAFMVESVVLGPPVEDTGPSPWLLAAVAGAAVLLVTAFVLGGDRGTVRPDVDALVGDHVESVGGGPVVVPVSLDR